MKLSDIKNLEEKLFDYIEGTLSETERRELEHLIEKDAGLKKELELIRRADALMAPASVVNIPSEDFSDAVMARLPAKSPRFKTSNRILWLALSLLGLIMAGAVLILPMLQSGESGYLIPQEWTPQLPSIDTEPFVRAFDNPALLQLALIVNVIALLLVLDRVFSKRVKVSV